MKTILLSELVPGTPAEHEYFDARGELLLSKDVVITQRHLAILRKRGIDRLYLHEVSEDEELKSMLSKEFGTLEELDLGDDEVGEADPHALTPEELCAVGKGREGLRRLAGSSRAASIDRAIQLGRMPDSPCGPPLRDRAAEKTVEKRDDAYKDGIARSYEQALDDVKLLLEMFARGSRVDGESARAVVQHFIGTFVTDRNILLNISSVKDTYSEFLYNHSLNVCLLAINIAAAYGYSEEQVEEIGMGALLHDVGMMLVEPSVRGKRGRLNEDEWFEIQKHPIIGLHLLERARRLPESVRLVAYQTHERENGKGYPKQRAGRFIHGYARIVQVADIFDALCAPRPYRGAFVPYKAMELLIKMTRTGLVSGEFVRALLCYSSLFPVGSLVQLTDGRVGKVVQANGTSFAKPTVTVLTDTSGRVLSPRCPYQVSLSENTDVQVARALRSDHLPSVTLMDGF